MSSESQAFNDGYDKGYAKGVSHLPELEAEIEALQADNAALQERIDALEAVGVEAMDRYVDAAEKNEALQKQVEGLRELIAKAYWNGHTEGRLFGKASMNAKEYKHGAKRIANLLPRRR